MPSVAETSSHARSRYAKCIEVSRRIRWDIDEDVIRGRQFDFSRKFLPDGLSRANELTFLDPPAQRLFSQVQGRTYAHMFALVERFIGAKMLELARDHALGDAAAMEALVRFTDEELKHQALFRRIGQMIDSGMASGYCFMANPDTVARSVLGASTWAVLALTCHIELFTQAHYRASIEPDPDLSALYKDVFLFHWREEAQHAILDEIEWELIDASIDQVKREEAVGELIGLFGAVDGILRAQAEADAAYFFRNCRRDLTVAQTEQVHAGLIRAYRWQYIGSGLVEPRFETALTTKIGPVQFTRIRQALAPVLA